jgi:myo-inositol-1(or 4)-monophosphatase
MTGSAVFELVSVATGRTDAYYEFGIKIWDICAGIILIREAGGVVVDPSGIFI